MKTEIEIPDGYEIDKLTFKKIEKKLPKTWEELGTVKGYYSNIKGCYSGATTSINKNVFPTKELAEASLAMAQLLQLRDAYNDGWVADWSDDTKKYVIKVFNNILAKNDYHLNQSVMNFKTAELRYEFFKNFKDLLTIAKPLL